MWGLADIDPFVTCQAEEAGWEFERPTDCDLDWAERQVSLGEQVTRGGCAGDTPFSEDVVTLEYGQGWVLDDLQCVSQQTGVTCHDRATGARRRGET